MKLPEPSEIRWALFGRHIHHDHLIRRLAREGFAKPIAIVSPDAEYDRDKRLLSEHGLFSQLESLVDQGLVEKIQLKSVNDAACLDMLRNHGCNCAFSISCRSIIKSPVIDFFERRIFNLHDSYLPNERGGALNSWRILNGVTSVGNTIHLLDEGIDTGDIIFQHQIVLTKTHPNPIDYDQAQLDSAHALLDQFVDHVMAQLPLPLVPQNDADSLYFPRLYTEINGAIDFSWPTTDIERFVRAFSDPYPGAWTYLNEEKIHIRQVEIMGRHQFHPFCHGRVVAVLEDGSIHVVGGNDMLKISELGIGGAWKPAGDVVRIMQILRTPAAELEAARTRIPKASEMV